MLDKPHPCAEVVAKTNPAQYQNWERTITPNAASGCFCQLEEPPIQLVLLYDRNAVLRHLLHFAIIICQAHVGQGVNVNPLNQSRFHATPREYLRDTLEQSTAGYRSTLADSAISKYWLRRPLCGSAYRQAGIRIAVNRLCFLASDGEGWRRTGASGLQLQSRDASGQKPNNC